MTTDNDIKKDYEEAYSAAEAHWSRYWQEAHKVLKFVLGDQWSTKDKNYLQSMDREALVWNKSHRIRNLITGYEQKNLLALTVQPFEGADEKTASQFSGIVMNNMLYGGGYIAASAAFEFGPVITGMNLIEPWVDKSEDLLNGDIRFRRLPYNRFVLDPTFQDKNLDVDCSYVITRDFFSKDQVAGLLPDREKEIMDFQSGASDSKFSQFYPLKSSNNEYKLKYDRFYTKVYRPWRILADRVTGRMMPLPDKKDPRLEEIIRMFMGRFGDRLKILKGRRKGVDLNIFVEGELMYSGKDSSGLDEYPFVLGAGYWTPEMDDPKYRMQGALWCCVDPGTEANRRRSAVLDMLDGVIRQGWKAKKGRVDNPEEMYSDGHAVVWLTEDAEMTDAEQLSAPQIPAGLFQALELMDRDHDSIPRINNEMLGSADNPDVEVAALLSKLRSASGFTTLQSLLGGHRNAKALLGRKQIKLIQKNYTPAKVARILGEPPTQEFYTRDFGKYDAVPAEGVLTDTQRQQHYAQVLAWKKAGAPIPWEHVIDFAPMEKKDKLKEAVQRAEAQQAKMLNDQQQMEQLGRMLMNTQMASDIAGAKEKISQAQENRSSAVLDRVKALKEAQGMDLDSMQKVFALFQQWLTMMRGESEQVNSSVPNSGSSAQLPGRGF